MPSFSIKTTGGHFDTPSFTEGDMVELGESITTTMRARIASSRDIYDAPAKPLSPRYARRKQRIQRGAAPVRNLRLSGRTLGAMGVLATTDHSVTVGFKDSTAYKRALLNQDIDPMFGLSNNDTEAVGKKVEDVLRRRVSQP